MINETLSIYNITNENEKTENYTESNSVSQEVASKKFFN